MLQSSSSLYLILIKVLNKSLQDFICAACSFCIPTTVAHKHSIYNWIWLNSKKGPEVMKKNSCSTQLSMKFFLHINVKMPC